MPKRSTVPILLEAEMHKMFRVVAAILIVGAISFAERVEALQQGTITGRVLNVQTGEPLASAQVVVQGTQIGGLTDPSGRYRLERVPTGTRTVRVVLIGYADGTQTVQVTAGDPVIVNFR